MPLRVSVFCEDCGDEFDPAEYSEGDECPNEDCPSHEVICSSCNGSGEGMYDGTTCGRCKGSGVIKGVFE